MKYKKIISASAVSTLMILTGVIGYYTIENHWSFEISSYLIFLFTLFYILILEQIIPLKQDWRPDKQTIWTDFKHLIFSAALFDALGKMLAISLVIYLQNQFFPTTDLWNSLPFFATFIIANLIGEFLPYIYHRVSHIGNTKSYLSLLLWKIHSIHHIPTSLNWFKTNWVHPINMFLNTTLKMFPILLLGFSDEIIFLVGITHVVVAYISHANIKTSRSFLDYLIVTPRVHHFHHSKKKEEAKNFGNVLPFWDLLLGTYYNRKGAVEEVGVVSGSETNYPKHQDYIKQLSFPFTTSRGCCN